MIYVISNLSGVHQGDEFLYIIIATTTTTMLVYRNHPQNGCSAAGFLYNFVDFPAKETIEAIQTKS